MAHACTMIMYTHVHVLARDAAERTVGARQLCGRCLSTVLTLSAHVRYCIHHTREFEPSNDATEARRGLPRACAYPIRLERVIHIRTCFIGASYSLGIAVTATWWAPLVEFGEQAFGCAHSDMMAKTAQTLDEARFARFSTDYGMHSRCSGTSMHIGRDIAAMGQPRYCQAGSLSQNKLAVKGMIYSTCCSLLLFVRTCWSWAMRQAHMQQRLDRA